MHRSSSGTESRFAQDTQPRESQAGETQFRLLECNEAAPLSAEQLQVWANCRAGCPSVCHAVVHLGGELDRRVLRAALESIIGRHEALRTTVCSRDDGLVQVVGAEGIGVSITDDELSDASQLEWIVQQELERPFELERGPLIRGRLLRISDREHIFLLMSHTIICDRSSLSLVITELSAAYGMCLAPNGNVASLSLKGQYRDYVKWQRGLLSDEQETAYVNRWVERLSGAPELLQIPTDRPRSQATTYGMARVPLALSAELSASLVEVSQLHGVTLLTVLLSGWAVLLSRTSGQKEIVVGIPTTSRDQPEFQCLVGCFENVLPLRIRCDGSATIEELFNEVNRGVSWVVAHRHVRLENIADALKLKRDPSYNQLFQAYFDLEDHSGETSACDSSGRPGFIIERLRCSSASAQLDLSLSMNRGLTGLSGSLMYATHLFCKESIERLVLRWKSLLEEMVTNSRRRLSVLPVLTVDERAEILHRFNAIAADYSNERLLHQMFEDQVARIPDAIAVSYERQSLTYAELNATANQLAWNLKDRGVGPDVLVGLCIERCLEMVIGLMGILKAGGAYVPLDPSFPADRLRYMIRDSAPRVILMHGRTSMRLPQTDAQIVALGEGAIGLEESRRRNPDPRSQGVRRSNLAYMIYTSGSTGLPKGAMNEHGGIVNRIQWMQQQYSLSREDRVLQKTPFSFDVSVWEFFWTLANGAQLIVARPNGHKDANYLRKVIEETGVTTLHFVPSMLQTFLATLTPGSCQSVKHIVCSGEELTTSLQRRCFECLPHAQLSNLYGPTEAAVDVTAWECSPDDESGRVPIGRPISNVQMYILDSRGEPVPVGVAGEIVIGGTCVGRGYFNRPDLTAERFVADSFSRNQPARMYKTGDLGRWRDDGNIEYLGRNDSQVKIRGFRIELGEIEAQLLQHPHVREAAVVVLENECGEKRLAGYVVADLARLKEFHQDTSSGSGGDIVDQWKTVFEETYSEAVAGPTFAGWNSSYTGQPIPEVEMREWVQVTVDRIRALKPARVLEIGCGVGLLLEHLAPECDIYRGTDISAVAIDRLRRWIARKPEWTHVELEQSSALQLDGFHSARYDTVILNSVVQLFPDASYLKEVLKRAVGWLMPAGRIFVGDVRPLGLLKVLQASVQLDRAAGSMSVRQLKTLIARAVEGEKDLLIDPRFFLQLAHELGIGSVRVLLRRGRADNELTRYRYDVVMDVTPRPSFIEQERIEWAANGDSMARLVARVAERPRRPIRICGIPNRRLHRDIAASRLIERAEESCTVEVLRSNLITADIEGEDPEVFWRIGEEHGYEVTVGWQLGREDGRFNVEMNVLSSGEGPVASGEVREEFPEAVTRKAEPLNRYANDPWGRLLQRQLIAQLREFLREKMPQYMVPTAIVALDEFPLTASGKLDRRALPALEREVYPRPYYEAPQGEIEETLATLWEELLRVEQIGRQDNFFELGGHSLLIVQMVDRLRRAGLSAGVQAVFDSPTLATLASSLRIEARQSFVAPPNLIPPSCEAITPAMLTLVELEAEHIARIVETVPGGVDNIQDIYPLAPLQEGILFHHTLIREHDAYISTTLFGVRSRMQLDAFVAALQYVMDRHDVLRTVILWEQLPRPVQVVYRKAILPVEEITLDADRDSMEQLRQRMAPERQWMNLRQAPLLRLQVAADPYGSQYYALLQLHHLVSDRISLEIMMSEVFLHLEGRASELGEPTQYRNHIAQMLSYGGLGEAEAFFRARLADIDEPAAPFGVSDVHGDGSRIVEASQRLETTLASRMLVQARRLKLSAAAIFHAAWGLVVSLTSGSNKVVFGTVLSGRMQDRAETRHTLGMFINTLPFRLRGATVKDLVEQTQRELSELVKYEAVSLTLAHRCSGISGSAPLFTALFNYAKSATGSDIARSGASAEIHVLARQWRTNYPVLLSVDDLGEGFLLAMETDRRIDPRRMLNYMTRAMRSLVEALENAPQMPVQLLSILPDAERHQVVELFNATRASYPHDRHIHELFEEQVGRTPDAVAVIYEGHSLTYAELNAKANQLARYLRGRGVRSHENVPIVMSRCVQMLIAQLAVLKCGGAYVPVDPEVPAQRQTFMFRDCSASHVVAAQGRGVRFEQEWVDWIDYTAVVEAIGALSAQDMQLPVQGLPAAYVMYTSGSTGEPKGVVVEHRSVIRLVINNGYAAIEPTDCIAHCSNPTFDAATFEIWGALLNGARVLLVPRSVVLDIVSFASLLRQQAVSILWLTAGLFAQYAMALSGVLPQLRYLLTGGDVVEPDGILRVLRSGAPVNLINAYGPTECTTFTTTYRIEEIDEDTTRVPIGRPISNTQTYILDGQRRPVPIGVVGELYIAGAGVARGYLNRPELTAERFVADPHSSDPRSRMYKTGDLGRWRADGTIEFVGRNDNQVKIRGFRIELGEIEAHLRRHPQVQDAVVLARENESGGKRLVAYVVCGNAREEGSAESLREHLKELVPQYMLPSAFVRLESLPLTPNGKLDRRALPAPEVGAYVRRGYEAPRGEVEEVLAGMWQSLLQVERVGRQDNFFELGGHSLLIVQLRERLRRIGLTVEIRRVFESATLADLARELRGLAPERYEVPPNLIPAGCKAITPEMLPLVQLEMQHIERVVATVPGGAGNIQDIYPLAPLQEGILFHHLIDQGGGDPYAWPMLLSLSSREKLEEFIQALQGVIDRHDTLRTAVLWDQLPEPLQVVYRQATLPVEVLTLDGDRGVLEQLEERMKPERQRLELRRAPMMRLEVALDSQGAQWHVLLQTHHLLCDNESLNILIAEVGAHLEGRAQGLPRPVAYRNHVAQTLAQARVHNSEAFFRNKLGDIDEPTTPFGLVNVHGDGSQINKAYEELDLELSKRVRTQARRLSVSVATFFHAAWSLVIAGTSGRDDVVFGTVLLGRLQGTAGGQHTLGMFINTLPLRLRLRGTTVRGLMEQTQRELVELLSYEQASLAVAQRCSGVAASTPLFSALLNYRHNVPNPVAAWSNVPGVTLVASQGGTNYPVLLSVDDLGERFLLEMETDRRIEPRRMLDYMTTAMGSMVEALEQAPQRPVQLLSILPEPERHQVIELFNATQVDRSQEKLIQELFEEQVARAPDAIAVTYQDSSLTYAQLNRRANQLARHLREGGIGPDQRVGICLERSLEMVVSVLGVLKAGGAYVPLDPSYPLERLEFIVNDSAPKLLLIQDEFRERLPKTSSELTALDSDWKEIALQPEENLNLRNLGLEAHNLAYVIYTSGSTGQPKGVMIEHRHVINLGSGLEHACYHSAECWRVALNASLNFDASIQQVLQLTVGRTLFVVPQETRRDPSQVLRFLDENQIDSIDCTPSQLKSWISAGLLKSNGCCLRRVLVGGEAIDEDLWNNLVRCGETEFYNVYGPTECTVDVTIASVKLDTRGQHIGHPMENRRIYILDHNEAPVPIGVTGEIHIGGVGVGRGYLNRPELTAERFVKDPFSADPRGRMYKTGDLGRWRADGNIEYLGRNDHQVKIRGFRIELGEIEAQLARQMHVRDAVVVARGDASGGKRLVAYVVPSDVSSSATGLRAEVLRTHLERVLPEHMIPSTFVVLESIPLTSNGKINRRALPEPSIEAHAIRHFDMPYGKVEELLAGIWQSLLKVERVGRHDNFFKLGGHSLLAIKVLSAITGSLGSTLSVADIYKYPTLRDLAIRISGTTLPDEYVNLSQEASLADLIVPKARHPRTSTQQVLLTGATGFVGRFLLAQLLNDTKATVHCLVRANSPLQAMSRVRNTLLKWNLWRDDFEKRLVAVSGDMSLPNLGLNNDTYDGLCDRVDTVFHCATSMNHLETYAMAKAPNVDGSREILKFAVCGTEKLINYISTLSVFSPSGIDEARTVDEDSLIDYERHLTSQGYVASKWVGEKIFMRATEEGVACNIFRLGLVWADTLLGRYDELQREHRVVKSCLLSGYGISDYRYQTHPIPVDYVARALVFLAARHCDGLGVFHITSAGQMTEGLFERCNEIAGTSLELVPFPEWIARIRQIHNEGRTLPVVPLIQSLLSMDADAHNDEGTGSAPIQFDCMKTQRELDSGHIVSPGLNDDLLKTYLDGMRLRDGELKELDRRAIGLETEARRLTTRAAVRATGV